MNERPEYLFIEDVQAAENALARIAHEDVVGLDTETFWNRATKRNQVALVQLAPPIGAVLVLDVLATGVDVVRSLIESPTVQMTAHNARFDELVLLGAGLQPAALVDTLRLARQTLALPSYSLAAVGAHLFGSALDKSLQQSNWGRRPLTQAQRQYAAADASMTLRVFDALKQRLEAEGRWAAQLHAATLTCAPPRQSRPRGQSRPKTPPPELTADERLAVTRLKKWRLERAFAQRVPAYMICADRTLAELAHTRPATLVELKSIYGLGESKITIYGADLLMAIRAAFS